MAKYLDYNGLKFLWQRIKEEDDKTLTAAEVRVREILALTDEDNKVVDLIQEVLDVFKNYPEELNLYELLNSKLSLSEKFNDSDESLGNYLTIPNLEVSGTVDFTDSDSVLKLGKLQLRSMEVLQGSGIPVLTDYSYGKSGQILRTDGTNVFWDDENDTTYDYANYLYMGLVKPIYSTTGAATYTEGHGPQSFAETPKISARSTTADRYYAVEIDKFGRLFVNVPWSWREVVDNLDSTETGKSLSANQGRVLNSKFDKYLSKEGGELTGNLIISGGKTFTVNPVADISTSGLAFNVSFEEFIDDPKLQTKKSQSVASAYAFKENGVYLSEKYGTTALTYAEIESAISNT